MSGAEAILVVGVISSIVSIVDVVQKVYDAVKNAQGLPQSFRAAAGRLPIIMNILNSAKQRIENGEIDEDACTAVKLIVNDCEEKAKKLDELFKKAIPANDATDLERYYKAVKAYGKKDEVEKLVEEIMKDVALLNSEQYMGIKAQIKHLAQDIAEHREPTEIDATVCMNALLLTDPRDDRGHLVRMKGSRVDGTCEWIKTNALYLSWLSSDSQLLWLSGGPGKGKTMISIYISEELEQVAKRSPNTVFLQYFCDNRDENRDKAISVLRGLIYQLLIFQPELFDHILPSFKILKKSLSNSSSFEALWRIFENMIRDPILSTVYCVLDGLDECDKASLEELLLKFKALFSTKSRESLPFHLNLIILSRDFPDIISELLSRFPRIRLDPDIDTEVNNDIRHFINVKVDELSIHQEYSESLREHVKNVFYNRAEGTFLWVGIVAQSLRNVKPSDVIELLDLFPPGLEPLYERMLFQVENDRREIVAKILRWVVMAVRPLTLLELSAVIGISPIVKYSTEFSCEEVMRDKVSYCGHFLIIEANEIRLIHQSVKDYLLRQKHDSDDVLEAFRIKEAAGNLEIARKCLDYLQSSALANGEVDLKNDVAHLKAFPFLSYAVLHWHEHTKSLSSSEDIFDLSRPFYHKESQIRMNWLNTFIHTRKDEGLGDITASITLLEFASYFGILPLVKNILKKGFINKAEHLLKIQKRNKIKNLALLWAVQRGHTDVVQLLLKNGADIEGGKKPTDTPLHRAAERANESMARLLLDQGANVNTKTRSGRTALVEAAERGRLAMVQLLVERGADVNAMPKHSNTALYGAAEIGSFDVVRLLLANGADIEAMCVYGDPALAGAAKSGNEAVVQLLLDEGANVEAKGNLGKTALIAAAQEGHVDVLRLLLNNGAHVDARDRFGSTALIEASDCWRDENGPAIIQALLEGGANIEAEQNNGSTALICAARRGRSEAVQLLVERGAHFEAGENEAMVRLMLEKEAAKGAARETLFAGRNRRLELSQAAEPAEPAQQELVELLITNPQPTETGVAE